MRPPENRDLPFFAYGIFQPGQLAFFQLKAMVKSIVNPVKIRGGLRMRDGLLIFDPYGEGTMPGALIEFFPEMRQEAYERIAQMEPENQYFWGTKQLVNENVTVNVLVGKSPQKGSVSHCEESCNGWEDPLFTAALEVIEETINSKDAVTFDWNMKPLFRLQMAYLLLWSSIERYASLRYHLGKERVMEKVKKIAVAEKGFALSLQKHVANTRKLSRADNPQDKVELDPDDALASIMYYYQVRSNITHRGKGIPRDYEILLLSTTELLAIFRDVLEYAQEESQIT